MNCQMVQNQSMELKDWITTIILLLTIISSHWVVSKQIRKTKKAKWIEGFRMEVAKYLSLSNKASRNNLTALYNIAESGYVILMLLDDNNKLHQLLNDEIVAFNAFSLQFTAADLDEYTKRIGNIKNIAKEIIKLEEWSI
jgi:hypothetical protein